MSIGADTPRSILRNGIKALSGSKDDAAIRDRGGCVTKIAEIIGSERLELLRVWGEDGRKALVVRCVDSAGGKNERRPEAPAEAVLPFRLAGLGVEATQHPFIDHRIEVAGMIHGRRNISDLPA